MSDSRIHRIGYCVDCGQTQTLGRHGECEICGSMSVMFRRVDMYGFNTQRRLMYEAAAANRNGEWPPDTSAMARAELAGGMCE